MKVVPLKTSSNKVFENIASDKSISHRFAIFSMLCSQPCIAQNYLLADDCLHTLEILKALGQKVEISENEVKITPKTIEIPKNSLDCGNSGTAMRLFMGFLSATNGEFILDGDKYLRTRPMGRVANPLKKIGADIISLNSDLTQKSEKTSENLSEILAPLKIKGKRLDRFFYEDKIGSAQVKSALILAGLLGSGGEIKESKKSRNHSENMLKSMGADIKINDDLIEILPIKNPLNPLKINIPNDPSSAFFFAVLTAITPKSSVTFCNMLLNPTRIEAYEVLKKMGVKIEFIHKTTQFGENIGDIKVEYSPLKSIEISEKIAFLIDEVPALSIAMAFAKGKSVVRNAKELRVKESDRIKAIVQNLKAFGIDCVELDDGFCINGLEGNLPPIQNANVQCFGDHRIAMSFAILGLKTGAILDEPGCVNASFSDFFEVIKNLNEN